MSVLNPPGVLVLPIEIKFQPDDIPWNEVEAISLPVGNCTVKLVFELTQNPSPPLIATSKS